MPSKTQTKQINLNSTSLTSAWTLSAVIFRSGNLPCSLTLRHQMSYFFGFVFIFLSKTQSPQNPFGNASKAGADRWGRTRKTGDTCGGHGKSVRLLEAGERESEWGGASSAALAESSATLQTATAALISPTGAIRSERRRMSAMGSRVGRRQVTSLAAGTQTSRAERNRAD